MMQHLTLLFTATLLLTIAGCSDTKNVPDDWPGIDEIKIINDTPATFNVDYTNSFDFNSQISLPKMGDDVSYEVISSCKKNDNSLFEKKTTYDASENTKETLDIITHLPEEMLIYPEFFTTCSFKLIATNQNGSVQPSNIYDSKFKQPTVEQYLITIDFKGAKRKYQLSKTGKAVLSLKDVEAAVISTAHNYTLNNIKLICHSETAREALIYNGSEPLMGMYGKSLILPTPIKNFPVENCIISAESAEGLTKGKVLISDRLSFKNTSTIDTFKVTLEDSINMTAPRNQHILYSRNEAPQKTLFTFKFDNQSDQIIKIELGRLTDLDFVDVITGLKEGRSSVDRTDRFQWVTPFSPILSNVPVEYSWTSETGSMNSNTITFTPHEKKVLSLEIKYDFNCQQNNGASSTENRNREIGFMSKLDRISPILNLKVITENTFLKNDLTSGNVFEQHKLAGRLHNTRASGVEGSLYANDSFTLFFRNSNSYGGTPFNSVYSQKINNAIFQQPQNSLMIMSENYRRADNIQQHYHFYSKKDRRNHDVCESFEIGG